MKRIASILLTAVLVITSYGIGAFADDAKTAEQPKSQTRSAVKTENAKAATIETKEAAQSSDAYDITKWNFHLDKTTFEYGVMKDKAKKYYGKHDEIATLSKVASHIQYTAPGNSSFNLNKDIKLDVTGGKTKGKDGEYYIEPGKHTLIIEAKSPYSGRVEIPFKVTPYKINDYLTDYYMYNTLGSYQYNGKAKCPKYRIRFDYIKWGTPSNGFLMLKEGRDYTIKYTYSTNKNVGAGCVSAVVKFKGGYIGTIKQRNFFAIVPKNTKIKSAKAGKNSITLKWKKKKDISGYQISVTDENYKRTKCYKIKSKNKTTYKIKGLKRHKKYYISLQTYKKVKPSKKYKGVNLWKKMESYGVHKTVKTK